MSELVYKAEQDSILHKLTFWRSGRDTKVTYQRYQKSESEINSWELIEEREIEQHTDLVSIFEGYRDIYEYIYDNICENLEGLPNPFDYLFADLFVMPGEVEEPQITLTDPLSVYG